MLYYTVCNYRDIFIGYNDYRSMFMADYESIKKLGMETQDG